MRFFSDADEIIKDSLKAAMVGPVAKLLKGAEEEVIEDWEHKPAIASVFEELKTLYRLTVLPKGVNKRYWVFVSFGIEPHPIRSKSGSNLFIKGGYSAKTRAGGGKGSGGYAGPMYWWPNPVVDNWPGIKPRYFEKRIKKDSERKIVSLIMSAWNKACAKAGK
jgi:hypothetical protein